jgi:hypothetical protein
MMMIDDGIRKKDSKIILNLLQERSTVGQAKLSHSGHVSLEDTHD